MDENTRCLVAATLAAGMLAANKSGFDHSDRSAQTAQLYFAAVLDKLPEGEPQKG